MQTHDDQAVAPYGIAGAENDVACLCDDFVDARDEHAGAAQGFTIEDILWAVGIWSAIIFLSPVILFYMLMVA